MGGPTGKAHGPSDLLVWYWVRSEPPAQGLHVTTANSSDRAEVVGAQAMASRVGEFVEYPTYIAH